MKRGDIGLIVALVIGVIVLTIWMLGDDNTYNGQKYAKVTVDGEHFQTIELSEEYQEIMIETTRGNNLLRIVNHSVHVYTADCPDQLCVAMGSMDRVGQQIVCLPNRVLVEIIGDSAEGGDVDAVVS